MPYLVDIVHQHCEHHQRGQQCSGGITAVTREQVSANLLKYQPGLAAFLKSSRSVSPKVKYFSTFEDQNQGISGHISDRENYERDQLRGYSGRAEYDKETTKNGRNRAHQHDYSPIRAYNYSPHHPPRQSSREGLGRQIDSRMTSMSHKKLSQMVENKRRANSKELRMHSRYLADTAFRKYFNKEVFQNYGRANTTNHADGFIYNNYLKSHNINPHSGYNMPLNQETFHHALLHGSPDKLGLPTEENIERMQRNGDFHLTTPEHRLREPRNILKKGRADMGPVIEDNYKLQKKFQDFGLKRVKSASNYYLGTGRVVGQQENEGRDTMKEARHVNYYDKVCESRSRNTARPREIKERPTNQRPFNQRPTQGRERNYPPQHNRPSQRQGEQQYEPFSQANGGKKSKQGSCLLIDSHNKPGKLINEMKVKERIDRPCQLNFDDFNYIQDKGNSRNSPGEDTERQ